jgi:hypothetical protein
MDNVTFIDMPNLDDTITTHAIIDRGNGEFTSMTKENYDKMMAEEQNG